MANVSVKRSAKGITIDISGAPNIDPKVIEGCINEVVNCGCLNNGVHLTAKCFDVVRRHEEQAHCVSSCFGCA
jgi:hypothetical protein